MHRYFQQVIAEIRRHKRPEWLRITLDILRAFDADEQANVVSELNKLRGEAIKNKYDANTTATLLLTPPAIRRTAILFHVFPPEQYSRRHQWSGDLGSMALEKSERSRCVLIGRQTSRWKDPYAYIGLVED